MITIALTGGIGSGKTSVCNFFQEIGETQTSHSMVKIIDADLITKNLLSGSLNAEKSSLLTQVKHLFGADCFNNNHLDRAKLRQLIFSSTTKKQKLESLLHPLIYQKIFSQIQKFSSEEEWLYQQEQKCFILIIAIPLLLETQTEKQFDRILVIDTNINLQIERSIKRDDCSQDLIEKIIHSQVDRQTRLDSADDIIVNNTDFNCLYIQVEELFQLYSSLALKEIQTINKR